MATQAQAMAEPQHKLGWGVLSAYLLMQYAVLIGLFAPVLITIALKVSNITSQSEKAYWLSLILGVGAIFAMIAAPVWGAISDRTQARIGRRKPFVMGGSIALLLGLAVMAAADSPWMVGLGWLICQVGSNAAQAALNAVMSDIVPEQQQGLMSALIGASLTAAMMTGVFITQFTDHNSYLMFLVPWLLCVIAIPVFVWLVPDRPASPESKLPLSLSALARSLWINPLAHPDFAWAFASRFLAFFAFAFAMNYQTYYLTDHMKVDQSEVARFMFLSTSVMGILTVILSLIGGWLSDRIGRRKPFVGVAALIMGTGLLNIAFAQSFEQFLLAAALTSIGQGLYFAVDIALCVAVLPNRDDAARDMAVLQIANSLPQSLAPAMAPMLLGIGGIAGANYPAMFGFAAIVALGAAIAIMPIRKVR